MRKAPQWLGVGILAALGLGGCSSWTANDQPPMPTQIDRGEYLTTMLGCGQCHTEGGLLGRPTGVWLAGSKVGVAYTADEHDQNPGIVFPKNLTPDSKTGLGDWDERDIVAALSGGLSHRGTQVNSVMPWTNYSLLKEQDLVDIAAYLKSLAPVSHVIPENIMPGAEVTTPYVRVGIYVFYPADSEVE